MSIQKPIGAAVKFEWVDTDPPVQDIAYFSFGDYNEVFESDSFGVPDSDIFYYVDGGEDGLREMMNSENPFEFKIIAYELTYPLQEVVVTSGEFPAIEVKHSMYEKAEAVYFAVVAHLGLEAKCIRDNLDGTTENTPEGEELYFLIEDTLNGD